MVLKLYAFLVNMGSIQLPGKSCNLYFVSRTRTQGHVETLQSKGRYPYKNHFVISEFVNSKP